MTESIPSYIPATLEGQPEAVKLQALADDAIRMLHRFRKKATDDPQLTEISKDIRHLISTYPDFCEKLAERMKKLAEITSKEGKIELRSLAATSRLCVQLKLMTLEQHNGIFPTEKPKKERTTSKDSKPLDSSDGLDSKKGNASGELNINTSTSQIIEEKISKEESKVNKEQERAETKRSEGLLGTEAIQDPKTKESSLFEETKSVNNVTLSESRDEENNKLTPNFGDHQSQNSNSQGQTTLDNTFLKDSLLPSDSRVNDSNVHEQEDISDHDSQNQSKRRRRRRAQHNENTEVSALDENKFEEPSIERSRIEETKDYSQLSISSNKSFTSQDDDDNIWDSYGSQKISIKALTIKTHESISNALVALLNQYLQSKEEKEHSYIEKIIAKAQKYCVEQKVMNDPTSTRYGQRIGPSCFQKANYNISIDGELLKGSFVEGMSALNKRFVNLTKSFDGKIECIFHPSLRFGLPKLLVHFKQKKISIALALNDEIGKHTSELIRHYREYDPTADQLIMLIKLWSSLQKISNEQKGYLSPFAWECLVIGFLQIQRILPSLQKGDYKSEKRTVSILGQKNYLTQIECDFGFEKDITALKSKRRRVVKKTLYSVLENFFQFYLDESEAESMISIRKGETIERPKTMTGISLFSIEDPFIPGFDVGGSCLRDSAQGKEILVKMKSALERLHTGDLSWIQEEF